MVISEGWCSGNDEVVVRVWGGTGCRRVVFCGCCGVKVVDGSSDACSVGVWFGPEVLRNRHVVSAHSSLVVLLFV